MKVVWWEGNVLGYLLVFIVSGWGLKILLFV